MALSALGIPRSCNDDRSSRQEFRANLATAEVLRESNHRAAMVILWTLLLVQSQPPDTGEPRRGTNRLLGLPCAQLDRECFSRSFEQWYADPYHFWLSMRERYVIVPPLFGMRFGEGSPARRSGPDSDALEAVVARARKIWGDDSISPAERRQRLFQLWDECDEDAPDGREARQRVQRFVREVAPRGTPRAYPEAQLRELNRKRSSKAQFAPYD
jgi:hypothetical protein